MNMINFENFTYNDALMFVNSVIRFTEEEETGSIRVRVYKDGDVIAQVLMDGKKGDLWLFKKQNTVMKTGHSSNYVEKHLDEFPNIKEDDECAAASGGYPLYINGKLRGAFTVSGLKTGEEDHELLMKSLKEVVNNYARPKAK